MSYARVLKAAEKADWKNDAAMDADQRGYKARADGIIFWLGRHGKQKTNGA